MKFADAYLIYSRAYSMRGVQGDVCIRTHDALPGVAVECERPDDFATICYQVALSLPSPRRQQFMSSTSCVFHATLSNGKHLFA